MSLLIEGGDYGGIVVLIVLIMLGPAVLFAIIGAICYKKNKKTAKVLFILAVVYLIISLGVCGGIMM